MAEKKIIAVLGATGAQGGDVVRAILNDPSGGFTARALPARRRQLPCCLQALHWVCCSPSRSDRDGVVSGEARKNLTSKEVSYNFRSEQHGRRVRGKTHA